MKNLTCANSFGPDWLLQKIIVKFNLCLALDDLLHEIHHEGHLLYACIHAREKVIAK